MYTKESPEALKFRKLFPRKFIPLDATDDDVFSRSMHEILNAYKVYDPQVLNMIFNKLSPKMPRQNRAVTFAVASNLIIQFEEKPEKLSKWVKDVAEFCSKPNFAIPEIEQVLSFMAYAYPRKGTEIYRATHKEMNAVAMHYLSKIDAFYSHKCDRLVEFSSHIIDDSRCEPEKMR